MSMEVVCTGAHGLTGPAFDKAGRLFVVSAQSGAVQQVIENDERSFLQTIVNTSGAPSGLAFDSQGMLFIADMAHQGIMMLSAGQVSEYVKEYEGKTFHGPNSLIFDTKGNLYFTDSGPLGTTSLQSPKGSLYVIRVDGELLQPILYECLAHPAGVALSPDERVLYVAETMQNRVLRCVQRPAGAFHVSVFHQFAGRLGPTALATDPRGNLWVALYDLSEVTRDGVLVCLSPAGDRISSVTLSGAEVSGLAVASDGSLFVTESSTNRLYCVKP